MWMGKGRERDKGSTRQTRKDCRKTHLIPSGCGGLPPGTHVIETTSIENIQGNGGLLYGREVERIKVGGGGRLGESLKRLTNKVRSEGEGGGRERNRCKVSSNINWRTGERHSG